MFREARQARGFCRRGLCRNGFVPIALALAACRGEPEARLETRIEALAPAPAPEPAADGACGFVEQEARKVGASMPRQLDGDTAALSVRARGCDLTLEYQLLTLAKADVAPGGMHAMRQRVAEQLCADQAARATLERGGTFTNVYQDQARLPIGQFTVSRNDCAEPELSHSSARRAL